MPIRRWPEGALMQQWAHGNDRHNHAFDDGRPLGIGPSRDVR
jgi:hypothetical protein